MRAALFLTILLWCAPAIANDGDGASPGKAREGVELVGIAVSGALSIVNVAKMATEDPSYRLGGASVVGGLVALALSSSSDANHKTGLAITGAFATLTGLVAIRASDSNDNPPKHVRLEPAFSRSAPALSLVVDF